MPYTKTIAEFKDLYRDWKNDQLIEMVTEPENYQPNAVQAAETILKERRVDYKALLKLQAPEEEMDEDVSYRELVEVEIAERLNSGKAPKRS